MFHARSFDVDSWELNKDSYVASSIGRDARIGRAQASRAGDREFDSLYQQQRKVSIIKLILVAT